MLRDLTDLNAYEQVFRALSRSGVSIQQDRDEIVWFLRFAKKYMRTASHRIVEIGSYLGGNLCLLSRLLETDGELISIEPELEVSLQVDVIRSLIDPVRLTHVKKKSNDPEALACFDQADILFIDGSHLYEDTKFDYENFAPRVVSPGLVVFHDIANEELGVSAFWKVLTLSEIVTVEKIIVLGVRGIGVCLL